tara:strand:+ start:692 stop:976 length:285 start_codon:yes stop_codon:yes gene_type:complete
MGLFCIKNYFTKSVDIGNRTPYIIVLIKLKEIKMEQKIEKIKQEYVRQYMRYIGYTGKSESLITIRSAKLDIYESVLMTLGVSPTEVLKKEKLI